MLRFALHVEVLFIEICTLPISDIAGVKYLCGYLHKGCDRAMVQAQVRVFLAGENDDSLHALKLKGGK